MDARYKRLPTLKEDAPRLSYETSTTLDGLDGPDDQEKGLDSDAELPARQATLLGKVSTQWIWLLHAFLLVTSLTLFALAINVRSSTLKYVREFSAWSPADVSVEYKSVKYNVSTKGNPFVGAGPDVDKAWRSISYDVGDQWISKSDIARLGMPDTSVKVNHPQTGEEGYRVGIEVFHQLHCLNLLRRIAYRDYYEPLGGEFAKGPEDVRAHADHCIEILRLNTQCYADIGLFTLYMVEGDPLAWPELNTRHVCRNFEAVKTWALDHSVGNMEAIQ